MKTNPLWQLTRVHVLGLLREPGALFWTFGFPILLTLALGFAFRSAGAPAIAVGTDDQSLADDMSGSKGLEVRVLPAPSLAEELRHSHIALAIMRDGNSVTYTFDEQRPEARAARLLADHALQRRAGRIDALQVRDASVTAKGARYVDWLVPGLLGMQLMSGSLWGIGYSLVNQRVRKLLKRFSATPMRRSDFLLSYIFSRFLWLPVEVGSLTLFATVAFGVELRGSLMAVSVLSLMGAASFSGLGALIGSRAENIETAGGLVNLVFLPMGLCSGVFFATSNFPAAVQPWLRLMPLTALNDALRAVFNDGASLVSQHGPLTIMAVWGVLSFALALKIFRWT